MSLLLLDTENADRNLTSLVTVLTDTPNVTDNLKCQALIKLGDGTNNLDASGGNFEVVITVGGQTIEPSPAIYSASTAARVIIYTKEFTVPANDQVVIKVKSPNALDVSVDVIAELYNANNTVASGGLIPTIV